MFRRQSDIILYNRTIAICSPLQTVTFQTTNFDQVYITSNEFPCTAGLKSNEKQAGSYSHNSYATITTDTSTWGVDIVAVRTRH